MVVHAHDEGDSPPRGKALLVEDEDLLRWSIERYLSKRGFAVHAVANGAAALTALAAADYDVVVTDLAIAGIDGLAVATEARRLSAETQVVIITVDVDDFKCYNDRFGHLAGDAVLARIAACLQKACRRDIDNAFRVGGDEFVLVLPEAERAVAAEVAARVRSLIAAEGINTTVSVGITALREGRDLKSLVREADEAMYRDKGGKAMAAAQRAS